MKTIWGLCFLLILIFTVTCQMQSVNSNNAPAAQTPAKQDSNPVAEIDKKSSDDDAYTVWIPQSIEDCLATVKLNETVEIMKPINPYYLRADFDGNSIEDFAILIVGKTSKKLGVVVCRDSKETSVFGEIAAANPKLTMFDRDDFVTPVWVIADKAETKDLAVSPSQRKVALDAKGESVGFIFEGGGSVFIFWNGKSFKVVESP